MNNWIVRGGRQSGRTTRIMQTAPRGAFFVWGTDDLRYPKALAAKLGREDLQIVGPSWFTARRYRGCDPINIRADHYVPWDEQTWEMWMHAKMYERLRTPPKKP